MGADPTVDGGLDARAVETHSAVLFFVGDRVYKMKKAVDLGFLDFTARESRLATCHQEVALNRRLAPDAYLGVADVLGTDGKPCEHLVVMRRMPDDRRMSRCIERGEDIDDDLRAIAHMVAALHDRRPPDPLHDQMASVADVRARWVSGFDQLRFVTGVSVDRSRDARIERLVTRYLDGRVPLFDHRIRKGRIRDGHGDLQAEDIFLVPEGPQVLDCLEFAEDFRWGDVLSDVAFLAMDLERLGRPDLGERFLALHRELSADRWPPSLAHHYIAYRAHVRAKVGVLRAVQDEQLVDPETERLFDLTLRHLEAARVRLVMVGGAPGTGKSTIAAELGERFQAVVLRSDEVRIRRQVDDPYRAEEVRSTYLQMLDEARQLLGLGEHVVLDATFGDAEVRRLVRDLAAETSSDLTELRCVLPSHRAAERVAARLEVGTDLSEATPDVARWLAAQFAPWPEADELDTSRPVAASVQEAASLVG